MQGCLVSVLQAQPVFSQQALGDFLLQAVVGHGQVHGPFGDLAFQAFIEQAEL